MQDNKYTLIREDGINKTVQPEYLVYHDIDFVGNKNENYTECAIYLWCLQQRKLLCSTPY